MSSTESRPREYYDYYIEQISITMNIIAIVCRIIGSMIIIYLWKVLKSENKKIKDEMLIEKLKDKNACQRVIDGDLFLSQIHDHLNANVSFPDSIPDKTDYSNEKSNETGSNKEKNYSIVSFQTNDNNKKEEDEQCIDEEKDKIDNQMFIQSIEENNAFDKIKPFIPKMINRNIGFPHTLSKDSHFEGFNTPKYT